MLGQRRRRKIKPTFGECAVFHGKALTVNTRESQLFLDPHGNTTIFVSTQSPHQRISELFTHRCRSSIFFDLYDLGTCF